MARRGQPEQDAGQQGNQGSETQDPRIDRNAITAGKAVSRQPHDQRHCGPGQGNPQKAPNNCHRQAFCQELANDVGTPGPQRDTDGHLAPPAGGADEQKIGDIGTGNQEHNAHCADQDPKRGVNVLHHLLEHRIDQR